MEITEDEDDDEYEYNELKDSDEEAKSDSDDEDLNNFESLKTKTMIKAQSRAGKFFSLLISDRRR